MDNPVLGIRFASLVFKWSGWYGIAALIPKYFLEGKIGQHFPPPITHPEYFYGFIGVALAWQFLFLVIAKDPVRFRPVMLYGALEKALFAVAVFFLFMQGRVAAATVAFTAIDLAMVALFIKAYFRTPKED
jgi:hypothetical protein